MTTEAVTEADLFDAMAGISIQAAALVDEFEATFDMRPQDARVGLVGHLCHMIGLDLTDPESLARDVMTRAGKG